MLRARLLPALLAAALAGCRPGGGEPGPGVLLIAVDGLRADHLSCMGYDRSTTPELDELAADGVLFADTWSTAPRPIPAHASLLTGCDPNVARLLLPAELELPEAARWSLPPEVPRVAVSFLAAGFATAAFLDTGELRPQGGYDDGFQVYEYEDFRSPRRRNERGGEALSARLRDWLATLPDGRPWFAYLHLRDLERTWRLPDPEFDEFFEPRPELDLVPPVAAEDEAFFAVPLTRWQGHAAPLGEYEARYDGAVRRVDRLLGALFRSLRVEGFFDRTTVAVVGTHGIQFGEAGLYMASGMLSEADLHVPFVLRPARGEEGGVPEARGVRAERLVSLVDVPATLLELAGLERPAGMHGRSQAGALRGEEGGPREHAFASCGFVTGTATIGERYLLERLEFSPRQTDWVRRWFGRESPEDEYEREVIYDRTRHARPPLGRVGSSAPPELTRELREATEYWRGNVFATWALLQGSAFVRADTDPEMVERLLDLGYLGRAPRRP